MDPDPEEAVPLSYIPPVKVRIKKKDKDEVEKCIENEYRRSIIVYTSSEPRLRTGWRSYIGICAAFAAAVFISLNLLIIKLLMDDYHIFTIICWRFVGAIPLVIAMFAFCLCRKRKELFRNVCPMQESEKFKWLPAVILMLNGILCWIYIALRYYSVQYLTLPDASVITFSSPIFVTILAHIFLKEKCSITSIVAAVIAVVGVGVIARPPLITGQDQFESGLLIGIGLALGGVFIYAVTNILIRKIRNVHFSITVLVHGLCGSLISIVGVLCLGVLELPQGRYEAFLAISLVLVGCGTQIMTTLALKFEQASRVTLILCLEVVLAFVWQYVFVGTAPDKYSYIGTAIILSTVLLVLTNKWLESLPEGNKLRKWCCCFLK